MADRDLSEDEIADLKEAFAMFDINGDGKLLPQCKRRVSRPCPWRFRPSVMQTGCSYTIFRLDFSVCRVLSLTIRNVTTCGWQSISNLWLSISRKGVHRF